MAGKAVVLTVYIFTFLVGLPINLMALYTFLVKVWKKSTPTDVLLLNLTVSDIILLLFLPIKMVEAASDMAWLLPAFLCPLTNYCFYGSIYISTLFLTAVSVERYLCVAHPIKYKAKRRTAYTVVACFFIWLLACSHCSIVFIVEYHNKTLSHSPKNFKCYTELSSAQLHFLHPVRLEISIVLFCLPFLITCFCYINVIRILASLPNIKPQKKKRAMGLAVATLLNFAIAFAPYNLSHIVGFIQNKAPSWRTEGFLISSLNTTLDPIIFFFSSTAIRQAFSDCLGGVRRKLQLVMPSCACFKVPGDKGKEGEVDGGSVSSLQSASPDSCMPTEASSEHITKTWAIKPLDTLPQVPCIQECPTPCQLREQPFLETFSQ
ncbi:free fatty acid receptor 2-like [Hemicordylus capensis]|uniref:free fatty acid receptor 2-like n=1 Tax=Hemicordylus capensis TaxID=884348 RepID=UPI002303993B|nr:free fatty acid receptor 2-like [Hemicordylus capensis]